MFLINGFLSNFLFANTITRLLALGSMTFAIVMAVWLFNNKRVIRKYRIEGASADLAVAVAIVLCISQRGPLIAIGALIILGLTMIMIHDHNHNGAVLRSKAKEAIKSRNDMMNVVKKTFPDFKEHEAQFNKRMKTDKDFKKKMIARRKEDLKYLRQGKMAPHMKRDLHNLDKLNKRLESLMADSKRFSRTMKQMLAKNPKMKKEHDDFEKRYKNDKVFKNQIDHEKGAGWQEFKPFRDKVYFKVKAIMKRQSSKNSDSQNN